MALSLKVKSRSKGVKSVDLDGITTVKDLKQSVLKSTKLGWNRQRITTVDKKVLDDENKALKEYGLKNGDEVLLKDLGPQISWRTVFLIEYVGPLFIHPLFYYDTPVSRLVYGAKPVQHSKMQTIALVLVLLHFLKRELETVFVHRFSNATMPFFNVFKNSFHYWGLSGLLLAVPIYGQRYSASALKGDLRAEDAYLYSVVGFWIFSELSNLVTHLHLRSLRTAGSRERKIPYGYGFNLVACPNYWFEALSWLAFVFLTGTPSSVIFLAVSAGQMGIWAKGKLRKYRKEFPDWPKSRKAMVPFVF